MTAGAAMVTDTLTVLRAQPSGRRGPQPLLAKRFRRSTAGPVIGVAYDKATWFSVEEPTVRGVGDIHQLLCALDGDRHAAVIRGAPKPHINRKRTRRRSNGKDAEFEERRRHWLMLDLDGIKLPPGIGALDGPGEAARAILDLLAYHAPELGDVSAAVRLSSSAGFDELAEIAAAQGQPAIWDGVKKTGVAAHVWIWLSTPRTGADIKRWIERLRADGLTIDPATTQTVQLHYTATPVFEGQLHDPLAGRRLVLVPGLEPGAELDIPP
jgi:hypothetical protein